MRLQATQGLLILKKIKKNTLILVFVVNSGFRTLHFFSDFSLLCFGTGVFSELQYSQLCTVNRSMKMKYVFFKRAYYHSWREGLLCMKKCSRDISSKIINTNYCSIQKLKRQKILTCRFRGPVVHRPESPPNWAEWAV